jgi:predicted RNA-binding protein Jag
VTDRAGRVVVELREFAAEDVDAATEKAAKHFGVSTDRLQVSVLSERMQISGVGSRVVVLATVRDDPPEVGPAAQFLSGVLQRMGLGDGLQLDESREEGEIILRVHGQSVRDLLRREKGVHGALTHLANRAAQKLVQPDVAVRIEFESEGGGAREGGGAPRGSRGGDRGSNRGSNRGSDRGSDRGSNRGSDRGSDRGSEDQLEEMARERAREARSRGEEVVLPPMNSRERWIVHNTLKTISGIRTESVGEGRLKRVKIYPA